METPPLLFIEVALLRLGKEMVDGLDFTSQTQRARQIVTYWEEAGSITGEVKAELMRCWEALVIDVATRDREAYIRRTEGFTDARDLNTEIQLGYINFCECVGNCLDPMYVVA